ncbi:MAG: hypothetical protein QW410_04030 [Nitrososphaerota archaeon]
MIGMIGEANQERLDSKLREKALELYRRLEGLPLPRFDGACIDFHQKRPAMVFVPEKELIAQVENGELPGFLVAQGVRRVLVDVLWPANANVLRKLIESGVEVWVLTRPSALHGWWKKGNKGTPKGLVEWLERHHPQVLKGFKGDIKNDAFDAVLLRYVKPKFMRPISKEYLTCWVRMVLFRTARRNYQRLINQLEAFGELSEDERWRLKMAEDHLVAEALAFVDIVRTNYPGIDGLFTKLNIADDVIAKAYCAEVFLELDERRSPHRARNLAGLRWNDDEDDEELLRDGEFSFALNQLTAKVFGVNPQLARKGFRKKEWKTLVKIHSFKRRLLMGSGPDASAGETRARVLGGY